MDTEGREGRCGEIIEGLVLLLSEFLLERKGSRPRIESSRKAT